MINTANASITSNFSVALSNPVETITYFWYFVADLLPRNSFTWTIALALETYVTFPIFFCTFTLFLLNQPLKLVAIEALGFAFSAYVRHLTP
jgi:hypothetical protein